MEAIARRYAESLFDLALEQDAVSLYASNMETVFSVFNDNPSIVSFFSHVMVEDQDKYQLLDKSFASSVDKYVLNFLKLLVKKRRIQYILDICRSYKKLQNQYVGIEEGIVYSSFELTDTQVKEIEEAISKRENKKIVLTSKIDTSLIGGIKVQLDNRIIDATIQNKLDILKKELLRK